MTRSDAEIYARRWADDWNRRDLDAVLAHFDDEVVFSSPKALATVGAPTVRGKAALRAYWAQALGAAQSLEFAVRRVIWDPESRELAILYDRLVNGQRDRAGELLTFGDAGRVTRGEVLYGVQP